MPLAVLLHALLDLEWVERECGSWGGRRCGCGRGGRGRGRTGLGGGERGGCAPGVEGGEDLVELLGVDEALVAPAFEHLCSASGGWHECYDRNSSGDVNADLDGAHEVRHALLTGRDDAVDETDEVAREVVDVRRGALACLPRPARVWFCEEARLA